VSAPKNPTNIEITLSEIISSICIVRYLADSGVMLASVFSTVKRGF
jgi:hypothetical protein